MAANEQNSSEQFHFDSKWRNISLSMVGIGVLAFVAGLFMYEGQRIWANLLVNATFFLFIALGATFFIAAHRIAQGGWHVALKRIPEAMSTFLPVAGFFMILIGVGTWLHWHELYHWAEPEVAEHDHIIAGKKPYLNAPFFNIRILIYLAGWIIFAYFIRRYSLQQDQNPDVKIKFYRRTNTISALFLVFFAVTSASSSWDWLMSIDTHWYSTLFGWYIFASFWVTTLAVMTLIVLFLKKQGYMQIVRTKHLRDLGQFMFAFTIFWTYLWFSQYMLIWYGNIPEETKYFLERQEHYSVLFYTNIVFNFFVPFLVLMSAGAKKRVSTLAIAAVAIVFGHWIDFFMRVMPGTVGAEWGLGLLEWGGLIGFAGLFIFIVFRALSQASLVPVNHPLLKESQTYHS
jgi:hypothetical protein